MPQVAEIVLLPVTSVHVLFMCYSSGVVVQSFLQLVLHCLSAYNDELHIARPSQYSLQQHGNSTKLKSPILTIMLEIQKLSSEYWLSPMETDELKGVEEKYSTYLDPLSLAELHSAISFTENPSYVSALKWSIHWGFNNYERIQSQPTIICKVPQLQSLYSWNQNPQFSKHLFIRIYGWGYNSNCGPDDMPSRCQNQFVVAAGQGISLFSLFGTLVTEPIMNSKDKRGMVESFMCMISACVMSNFLWAMELSSEYTMELNYVQTDIKMTIAEKNQWLQCSDSEIKMVFKYSHMGSSGNPPVNGNDTAVNLNLSAKVSLLTEYAVSCTLRNGIMRDKGRLLIGCKDQLKLQLFDSFHKSALGEHSGEKATYQRLKLFYWPGNDMASTHISMGLMEVFFKSQMNNFLDNVFPKTLYDFPHPQGGEDVMTDCPDLTAQEQINNKRAAQQVIKDNVQKAQAETKHLEDDHRSDIKIIVRNMVYLKIQSYRPTSLSTRRSVKLHSNFYAGQAIIPSSAIPLMDSKGTIKVATIAIVNRYLIPTNNVVQWLIQWRNLSEGEATWKRRHLSQKIFFFSILEDKDAKEGALSGS
ncbi:unnamed protein product [Urochloa humidicola]